MKDKILRTLLKYIDIKGLLKEAIDEHLDEALQKVVDDSSNPVDNTVKALVYPPLEKELLNIIDEKFDIEKILGLDENAAE